MDLMEVATEEGADVGDDHAESTVVFCFNHAAFGVAGEKLLRACAMSE